MCLSILILEPVNSCWLAHSDAIEAIFLSGPAPETSMEILSEFAVATAKKISQVPARIVIVFSELAASPMLGQSDVGDPIILFVTLTVALAHLAPETWIKFLVIDLDNLPCARIVTRHRSTFSEDTISSADPTQLCDLMQMLDIRYAFIRSSKADEAEQAKVYERLFGEGVYTEIVHESRAHITGAEMLAKQVQCGPGVWQVEPGRLRVSMERDISYDLYRFKRYIFDPSENTLADVVGQRPVLLVIDRKVDQLFGESIRHYGRERLDVVGEIVCGGTESDKTMRTVEEICHVAFQAGLGRDGVVIAIGGGCTLDVAGFAASIFRRGVPYIRIPTTLIGIIDVAVGVKHAANAFGSKNLLGSFYPPLACLLDYTFLKALPKSCISAGFAEILKMAVILDENLLEEIEVHGRSLIDSGYQSPQEAGRKIAERAELLMADELARNLFEEDHARRVDFGHTFSPIIEVGSNYRISHGEAVALDILLSTSIAVNYGICSSDLFDRLVRLISWLGLLLWHDDLPTAAQLEDALSSAQRHRGGSLNLVVPQCAGLSTFLQQVSLDQLSAARRVLRLAAQRNGYSIQVALEDTDYASFSV